MPVPINEIIDMEKEMISWPKKILDFLEEDKSLAFEFEEIANNFIPTYSDMPDKLKLKPKDIIQGGNAGRLLAEALSLSVRGVDLAENLVKELIRIQIEKEEFIIAAILGVLIREGEITYRTYKNIIYFSVA